MINIARSRRLIPAVMALALLGGVAFFNSDGGVQLNSQGCAVGTHRLFMEEQGIRDGIGVQAAMRTGPCIADKHPEPPSDLEAMESQQLAKSSAPDGVIPSGAFSSAVSQRAQVLRQGQSPANANAWVQRGNGPLRGGEADYGMIALGIRDLNGRITQFDAVPSSDKYYPNTVFASVAYGGIWMTDETLQKWVSIGEGLPTQTMGGVAYTPYRGGTVIALSGDGSFGADSREGAGVYYTTDTGRHWHHSTGVPDDAFGFRLAVDKSNPKVVYAATGAGLYRSADGGVSFANVKLPTGACAGKSNRIRACLLANMVTDVAVLRPGGITKEKGGKVVAAVGWRGGNAANPDGTVQSPANGIYVSDTGAPGSFTKSAATGFAPQDRIGRVEFGAASGPDQDHNYLYAMVQDAILLRKGTPAIDAPVTTPICEPVAGNCVAIPTVFNGVYVSPDFGATWVLMTDATALQSPNSGSALILNEALGGYGPGVQSWYNEWIQPDPSLADPITGAPTRLLFGLEEVWENDTGAAAAQATAPPMTGPASFHVIGRYWAGESCLGTTGLLPPGICPFNRESPTAAVTTTHPDQHDATFITHDDGRVTLVVGNDGGVYKQTVAPGFDFDNKGWGDGANQGFNTLLPYDAVRAKDGTIWMGLQDNGTAKIVDIKRNGRVVERDRQIQTFGGDGFFVGVDPNNSNYAYEEYVGGTMSATTDGGHTWTSMAPPISNALFSTPFVVDPLDPKHVMIAGREVVETGAGAGTSSEDWTQVWNLGTAAHPGSASAAETPDDPANQMTAVDMVGPAAYVGYCGVCDVLNKAAPFKNGLVTNVGGTKAPKRYSKQGWHVAKAIGLPNRYITAIAMDPANPKTVFVSLGGYYRPWTPPNIAGAANKKAAGRHLFVSTDAGEHFTDISANLPNTPINWIALRGDQILVASDVGVFASDPSVSCANPGALSCQKFEVLGKGLPSAAVFTVRVSGGDFNTVVAATYGRGVYEYHFGPPKPYGPKPAKPIPAPKFLGKLVAGPYGFETDEENWTPNSDTPAEEWSRIPPGANNSSTSFAVTPYTNEATASLTSPKMKLTQRSTVKVSWFERRDTEPGFDYMSLEWSHDGFIWNAAGAWSGQNADFPDFTKNAARFVAPAGNLYIRFRLSSDQLISFPPYTGVAVDDIKIER